MAVQSRRGVEGPRKAKTANKILKAWRTDKTQTKDKPHKPVAVCYARQSSGSSWTHGKKRQMEASLAALKKYQKAAATKMPVRKVAEIISGSLPFERRRTLTELLEDPSVKVIAVESLRALARKTMVGEEIHQKAILHKKTIIPADMPDAFSLEVSSMASNALSRRCVLAAQEYEKDQIVYRTQNAIKAKRAEEAKKGGKMRKTQKGKPKVNGRKNILEECKATKRQHNNSLTLCQQRAQGKFGWRVLAARLSQVLKLKKDMTHEAARRNSALLISAGRRRV
jgi:DNA invertase Pin-like site-specific DNA recombinase